jgi:hypothetical protein
VFAGEGESAWGSSRSTVRLSPQSARLHFALVVLLSCAATIPVWIATFPPMVDLPQHAAQVSLIRAMADSAFGYRSYLQLNWFTPYLFGYLMVYGLVPAFGIVTACKVVVSMALAAMPIATAVVMTETETDRRWALLAIPASYGFSYQWGLLNFIVAAPIGLLFVWLTLRHVRSRTLTSEIGLAVLLNGLFFCHAMICLFFGLIAALVLLSGATRRTVVRQVLPLMSVVPLMLIWMTHALDSPIAHRPTLWDLNWLRTSDIYYTTLGTDTPLGAWSWGRLSGLLPRLLGVPLSLFTLLMGSALFVLPIVAGARPARRSAHTIPFLVCLITLFLVPGQLFGTQLAFQRFTTFLLPLFLVALQRPSHQSSWPAWTWPAATALVVLCIAGASTRAVKFNEQASGFTEIIAHMEPYQRVLSFPFERESGTAIAPVFLHFAAWYSAIKSGVVDPSFAETHVQLVRFTAEHMPRPRLWGFEWQPDEFDWKRMHGPQYRYFIVKSAEDRGASLFRDAPCSLQLVHHADHWWLYERAVTCTN